ncbi:MAG TPA: hypothetical protein VKX49_25125 [Bryobacteraceae bacterium]|jgi:hypothetical protein|nr:hypothetical protein [Bryobacteraceae bacterium]
MRRRTKALIGIAIFIVLLAACRLYYVDEGGGSWLLWNDKEAYCFNTVARRGYSVSYLRYPWALLMEYLGAPLLPDEDRWYLEVIRVTSAGVEHHTLRLVGPGASPRRYTGIEGSIYAECQSSLCRWAGDHFEDATPQERRRLGDISQLDKDEDIEHENGWSKRTPISPHLHDLTIAVGDQFAISVTRSAANDPTNHALSISIIRPGRAAEKIGEIPERKGRISRSEYRRLFPRQSSLTDTRE